MRSRFPQSSSGKRSDNSVVKISGHSDDFLFFHLPLSGDCDMECDLIRPGLYSTQVMLAGRYFGWHGDQKSMETGTFRTIDPSRAIDLHPSPVPEPGTIFGESSGMGCSDLSSTADRRAISQFPDLGAPDPWIAILPPLLRAAEPENRGAVLVVLDAVPLSGPKDKRDGSAITKKTISGGGGHLESRQDPNLERRICRPSQPSLAGMFAESLLTYLPPIRKMVHLNTTFTASQDASKHICGSIGWHS